MVISIRKGVKHYEKNGGCFCTYAFNNIFYRISVCAYGEHNTISPYYLYTYSAESNLNIVGDTAYCKSVIKGGSAVTQINATQYLEKKNGSKWESVSNGTWSDSINGKSLTLRNSMSNLDNGTYRVRTVATVYSDRELELIEKTSKEITV